MEIRYILIHYSEIGLKGQNRPFFQRILRERIRNKLPRSCSILLEDQRYIVECNDSLVIPSVLGSLKTVFGIAWFAPAYKMEATIESIERCIMEKGEELFGKAETFRVSTSRANKLFPFSSQEVDERIGEGIGKKFGLRVDLKNPQKNVHVEILSRDAYIYTDTCEGLRGLPVGSSGKVLSLFSGGIDSPVATFLAMKRGCEVACIHVHAFRSFEELSGSKIEKLFTILAFYGGPIRTFFVPFFHFQTKVLGIDARYELLLFRRFIVKAGAELARELGHEALVMGDNLGQVASQTLPYLNLTDHDITLPILRPLIGFTKEEIVERAKYYGTYESSIEGYKDCCSIVASHPTLNPARERLDELEEKIDLDAIVKKTIENREEKIYE